MNPYEIIGWAEGYMDEGGGASEREASVLKLWQSMKGWTTEPPTQAGLYWYSFFFDGKWQAPTEKRLSVFGGELCEEVCGTDGGEYEPIKYFLSGKNSRWLGPLPAPEPPTE